MANSDKNILITPSVGLSTSPTIKFNGANNTPTTLRVLDDGTVSFEGTAGQLFSISDGLTGSIFSVNDISGIPSIEVLDTGLVKLNQYGGSTVFGASAAIQNGSAVNAKVSISTVSATTPGLIIKSVASQSANLQEWQNSAGSILASLNQYGTLTVGGNLIVSTYTALGASTRGTEKLFVLSTSASEPAAVFKAAASQTANLQEWQNSSGTSLVSVSSSGDIFSSSRIVGFRYGRFGNDISYTDDAPLRVTSNGASTVVSIVKGAASQTANLQEWQDSTGAVKMSINQYGSIVASAGGTYISTFGDALFGARNATTIPLTVKGAASQTANLQEWQSSNGTVQSRMTDIGKLFSNYLQSSYGILTGNATYAGGYNFISNPSFATTDVSLIVKAVTSQTANLQEWQDSAGTVLVSVLSNGRTTIRSNGSDYGAALSVGTNSTTAVGLAVRGVTSQTANLQEWQNSAGTVVSSISNAGLATFSNVGVTNNINAYYGKISANTQALGYLGQLSAITANASTIGLVVRGFASQTANLQEWQNSSGTVENAIIPGKGLLFNLGNDALGSQNLTQIAFGFSSVSSSTGNWKHWIITKHNNATSVNNAVEFYTNDGTQSGVYPTNAIFGFSVTNGGIITPKENINIASASAVGLTIKAAASQSANLQEWQDSSGTVLGFFASNGTLKSNYVQTTLLRSPLSDKSQIYTDADGNGAIRLDAGGPTQKGFIIRGAASQTAPLQEWQDSAGTVLARIESNGSAYFVTLQNSSGQNVLRAESSRNLTILTGGTGSFGGGGGVLFVANATTVPSSDPSGGGILYVEGGALKYRGSSGTVTTIANA